jgi:hypothetical protein
MARPFKRQALARRYCVSERSHFVDRRAIFAFFRFLSTFGAARPTKCLHFSIRLHAASHSRPPQISRKNSRFRRTPPYAGAKPLKSLEHRVAAARPDFPYFCRVVAAHTACYRLDPFRPHGALRP